jgi:murein DD-endopeptidase MepM/ murein hydrolase activator NlpD
MEDYKGEKTLFFSRYLHLDSVGVSKGDYVSLSSELGKSGNTDGNSGRNTGPHLHLEIRTKVILDEDNIAKINQFLNSGPTDDFPEDIISSIGSKSININSLVK